MLNDFLFPAGLLILWSPVVFAQDKLKNPINMAKPILFIKRFKSLIKFGKTKNIHFGLKS